MNRNRLISKTIFLGGHYIKYGEDVYKINITEIPWYKKYVTRNGISSKNFINWISIES